MSEPKFPRRLDIVDMPTDQFNVTGNLRNQLCKVTNYCREFPAKREFLVGVLEYTLKRIEQIAADDEKEKAAKAKARAAREAAPAGPETASKEGEPTAQVSDKSATTVKSGAVKPAAKPAATNAKVDSNPA